MPLMALLLILLMQMPASMQMQERPYIPQLAVGDVVPAVRLIDQADQPLTFRGQTYPTLLSFMYTRCPDARMCPLVTAKFGRLAALLAGSHMRLVEVTLDPQFDRPGVLRQYAMSVHAVDPAWFFATGQPQDIAMLANRLGIAPSGQPGRQFIHAEALVMLSGDGEVLKILPGTSWLPEDVAAEAKYIALLSSSPWRRIELVLRSSASALCGRRTSGGLPTIAAIAIFLVLTTFFAMLLLRIKVGISR